MNYSHSYVPSQGYVGSGYNIYNNGHYSHAPGFVPSNMAQVYPNGAGYVPTMNYPYPHDAYPHAYPGGVYNPYSLGSRLRQFFGLAPTNNVRYKHDRGSWGFMGYSRRQRYIDPRTGGEVDRHGRPVYRV